MKLLKIKGHHSLTKMEDYRIEKDFFFLPNIHSLVDYYLKHIKNSTRTLLFETHKELKFFLL